MSDYRPRTTRTQRITAGDTNSTRLPTQGASLITIQADPTNAAGSTVEILGLTVEETTVTIDTQGVKLAPGDYLPPQWLSNLNQLAYKASTSGLILNVMVQA